VDSKSCQLVIVRHGESEWNKLNLFTGWRDVRLTAQGEAEAREAGRLLREGGFEFDLCFTSLQSRAIKTLWLALEEMDRMYLPVTKHWRLNERHYGKLQGANKSEAVAKFGEEQVLQWRRSYDIPPPPVDLDSPDFPKADPRYAAVPASELPRGESLKDVLGRVMPYWTSTILPELKAGKRVIIAAHGNSLRALLKHLEGVSDSEIVGINIPTGVPRAYKLNAQFLAEKADYLGDAAELEKKIAAVKSQTARK
jgi:2,3-bisphosphoglycerate-dependent phosphoglycerate mutase